MRTYQEWMDAYGVDHQHPTNKLIHKICVPSIMFSIIGILWALPRIEVMGMMLNWAYLLVIGAMLFYISLKNTKMILMMVLQTGIMCLICEWLYQKQVLMSVSIGVFVIAWIGQFIGHKIEGRKPSFLQDLSFLLVGPLWVNRSLLNKFNLRD